MMGDITDTTEDLSEKPLAAPSRNPASPRPPSFGPIVRGEMTREGDGEILAELSGRKSMVDLPGLTNHGLSKGRSAGRRTPLAPRRPPP